MSRLSQSVLETYARAVGVVNVRYVANRIVCIVRGALGRAPAAENRSGSIVTVDEHHAADLVGFCRHAPEGIVRPFCGLVLSVRQRQQVAGRIVGVQIRLRIGIYFLGLAPQGIDNFFRVVSCHLSFGKLQFELWRK